MPKAAVIVEPGRLEIRDLPRPAVEAGGMRLRVLLSEVCGTDVHLLHGQLPETPYPLVPGHFAVGEALETGGTVHDVDGAPIRPGETITFLDVHGTCGECWYCQVAKASTRCPRRRVYGITYGVQDGLCGGWSEEMMLKPGTRLVKLDGIAPEAFMGGGCGLMTALHAVEQADIRLGDAVVVQGSGPVGLNALALARLKGATALLLTGGGAARLEMARRLGADAVCDIAGSTPEDRIAWVKEQTGGRGADIVIEATGVPQALAEGFDMARDAGVYIIVGQYTDAGEMFVNPHRQINKKHLRIQGVWGIDSSHLYRGLRVLRRYQETIPWASMLTRLYRLEEAEDALSAVASQQVVKAGIRPF
ncbi:MAG: zinc-binding dehydrogenase [Armatimonadetes bacterium]|nr:zinc-binding dehydrogenase [Armatimonadota bacterium]